MQLRALRADIPTSTSALLVGFDDASTAVLQQAIDAA